MDDNKQDIQRIDMRALRRTAQSKHLRMRISEFNHILKLLSVGYDWNELCSIAGGELLIHKVAWLCGRMPHLHEQLTNAYAQGAQWRKIKLESGIVNVDDVEDSATRLARDKLRLSLVTDAKKSNDIKDLGKGIGQAIVEAQQRIADSAHVVDVQAIDVHDIDTLDVKRS